MVAGAGQVADHDRHLPALRPVDPAARPVRPIRPLRGISHFPYGKPFPLALLLHLAHKAKPLASQGADQNLPLAIVTDGVANRGDLAAERGLPRLMLYP